MTPSLEDKREWIRHREQLIAYELAKTLIPKPKVTVWIILLPLLFLFFLQDLKRYKTGISSFADNFLKNKNIALDLTYHALQEDVPLEQSLTGFATDSQPESDTHQELFEKQLDEIRYLAEHYQRLMTSDGRNYESLVQLAYRTAADYRQFLDRLGELEDAVLQTAFQIQAPEGESRQLADRLQNAVRSIRRKAVDEIFH